MGYHSEKIINELNEKTQQFRLDVLDMIFIIGLEQ